MAVTPGAKVEADVEGQTPAVRREGASVRLRGVCAIKAGQELVAAETLFTVPAGYRPPAKVFLAAYSTVASAYLQITSGGVATWPTVNLGAAKTVALDGITWNLT